MSMHTATVNQRIFGGRASLTAKFKPEFERMTHTCIAIGMAHPSWTIPDFFARRSRRHRGTHGVATSLGGVVLEVRIQVGTRSDLADVHECMLHELAHAMVGPREDHGPKFRETLRRLVRAHWPSIRPWQEVDRTDDAGVYAEDDNIAAALRRLYATEKKP